jgi:hypothetical protein
MKKLTRDRVVPIIVTTEMPIATALRQKDFGDIASLPLDRTMQADCTAPASR